MNHPRLGPLTRDESRWEGLIALPTFSKPGENLRNAEDPPEGLIHIRIEDHSGTGLSSEQEAALNHLLDREPEAFAAVWGELAGVLPHMDRQTELLCTEVEVSQLHIQGVAYLGFSIDGECHLEHGLQIVYHPTRGTFWGDWEALNSIEEADNL